MTGTSFVKVLMAWNKYTHDSYNGWEKVPMDAEDGSSEEPEEPAYRLDKYGRKYVLPEDVLDKRLDHSSRLRNYDLAIEVNSNGEPIVRVTKDMAPKTTTLTLSQAATDDDEPTKIFVLKPRKKTKRRLPE